MLEVFSLAESTPFPEVSEALLQNCVDFLLAILATPSDYDKFVKEHSEETGALRLLARVDLGKMAFVDTRPCSIMEVCGMPRRKVSYLLNLSMN